MTCRWCNSSFWQFLVESIAAEVHCFRLVLLTTLFTTWSAGKQPCITQVLAKQFQTTLYYTNYFLQTCFCSKTTEIIIRWLTIQGERMGFPWRPAENFWAMGLQKNSRVWSTINTFWYIRHCPICPYFRVNVFIYNEQMRICTNLWCDNNLWSLLTTSFNLYTRCSSREGHRGSSLERSWNTQFSATS